MDEYIIHINKRDKTESLQNIEDAITAMHNSDGEIAHEAVIAVLEAIRVAITKSDRFVIPVEMQQSAVDIITANGVQVGNVVETPDDPRFKIRTLQLKNGTVVFAAFTSQEEVMEGESTSTVTEDIESYLEKVLMNLADIFGIKHTIVLILEADIDFLCPVVVRNSVLNDHLNHSMLTAAEQ